MVLGTVLCLLVILFWKENNQGIKKTLETKVSETSQLVTQQLQGVLLENVNKLTNLKRRLEITDGDYFEYWNKDAASIIAKDPSFHFVEWIDSTGVIQLVEPLNANKEAIGLDITQLDYRAPSWTKTRKDSLYNVTHWLELVQGDYAFLVDAPIFIDNKFHGTITAGIDISKQFDNTLRGLEKYHINIRDDRGTVFYSHGDTTGTKEMASYEARQQIEVGDVNNGQWAITMVPNQLFQQANANNGNLGNLLMALVLCGLVSVCFFFMQKSSAAEKSHKEANLKIRALIDSSPLAIFVVNTEGVVTDLWNEAAEEMFGWSREEAIGSFIPFVQDNNISEFKQLMQDCIEEGKLKDQEVKRSRKDGSEGIFLLNIGTIDRDEKQMLVLVEDITEVKKYEQQLKESLDEKEILLAEIHHRVKNNLALIAGLIDLQKEQVGNQQIQQLLNETKNRVFSIAGVHEQLYNTPNFSDISLSAYIDQLLDRLQDTYENRNREVHIAKSLNNFSVNINQAVPFGLLLNELITNSYKHAFGGTDEPRISLKLRKSNNKISFSYQDNGPGLNKSEFQQRNSLGLNLIRTLLAQIEADYKIDSADNDGFDISFTAPYESKGSQSTL